MKRDKLFFLWFLTFSSLYSLAEAPPDILSVANKVKQSLLEIGFKVQDGKYWFFKPEHCGPFLESGVPTCDGPNPGSPYGQYLFKPEPGETNFTNVLAAMKKIDPAYEGYQNAHQIRPEEAFVALSVTPNDARYMSFSEQVLSNTVGGQSAGLAMDADYPLNHETIKKQIGTLSAYNQRIAMITSASQQTDSLVRNFLVKAGWNPKHILSTKIPTKDVSLNLGYGSAGAVLMRFDRFAYSKDSTFFSNPPVVVFRAYNPQLTNNAPYGPPPMQDLMTNISEGGLQPALDILRKAVERSEKLKGQATLAKDVIKNLLRTDVCLNQDFPKLGIPCIGTLDASYMIHMPSYAMGNLSTDAMYFVGVNHTLTQKATYTSATLQNSKRAVVASLNDQELLNSALSFLKYTDPSERAILEPVIEKFYVAKFARVCGSSEKFCRAIRDSSQMDSSGLYGLPADENAGYTERGYLDPFSPSNRRADLQQVLAPGFILVGSTVKNYEGVE